ncbi:hypothetical protein RQN30_06445 [Arcanobacterium hippocoleae]
MKFGMDRAGKAAETKAVLENNAAAGESLPGAELQDAALQEETLPGAELQDETLQEETLQGEAVKDEVLNRALNTLTENRCRESRIHLWPPEIAEKIGHPLIVGIAQDLESARSEVKIGDGIVVLGEIAEENEICAIARRLPAWGASGVWFLPAGTVVNEKLSDSFNTFVELENFPAERKNFSAENEIVPAIKIFSRCSLKGSAGKAAAKTRNGSVLPARMRGGWRKF